MSWLSKASSKDMDIPIIYWETDLLSLAAQVFAITMLPFSPGMRVNALPCKYVPDLWTFILFSYFINFTYVFIVFVSKPKLLLSLILISCFALCTYSFMYVCMYVSPANVWVFKSSSHLKILSNPKIKHLMAPNSLGPQHVIIVVAYRPPSLSPTSLLRISTFLFCVKHLGIVLAIWEGERGRVMWYGRVHKVETVYKSQNCCLKG